MTLSNVHQGVLGNTCILSMLYLLRIKKTYMQCIIYIYISNLGNVHAAMYK